MKAEADMTATKRRWSGSFSALTRKASRKAGVKAAGATVSAEVTANAGTMAWIWMATTVTDTASAVASRVRVDTHVIAGVKSAGGGRRLPPF